MNDRFKFRVWDKYMHETPAEQMQFLCFNGCLVDSNGCHYSPDDYIIEQCTGLKDKNGNLIYEGDLIKTANYKTGLPEIYVVKWCADCGLYQLESTQSEQIIDMFRVEKGIIIGNIHKQAEQKDK